MAAELLSVVMPTHNRPERLLEAATSVLSQQLVEIELVIVDDGSEPPTVAATEQLATDPRVTVVRNEVPVGPGGARNQGIAVTRGSLLGFCDDDDAWLPGAAGIAVGTLEADPDLGFVTAWHRVVHDGSGRVVDYRGPVAFGADELLWFNFVALPFGIIRRSHFPDGLAFDQTLPPCEDWDLWLRCAQARPVGVIPRVLYSYHQHGGDRVTGKQGSGRRGGRQAFLDKHSPSMTEACRTYHRAVIAQDAGGREAMARELAATATRHPGASSLAGTVLGTWFTTSAVGIRRRDPGLSARTMARLLAGSGQTGRSTPHR
jgi:hypothetical protein